MAPFTVKWGIMATGGIAESMYAAMRNKIADLSPTRNHKLTMIFLSFLQGPPDRPCVS